MFLSSHQQTETVPSHRLLYKLTRAGRETTTQFRFTAQMNEKVLFKMSAFSPLA